MILLFYFAIVLLLLSHPPLLPFTKATNTSTPPICPKCFHCADFNSFEYPFYNNTDTRCGLVEAKCIKNGAEILLGDGKSYEVKGKFWDGPSALIYNETFQKLIHNRSCEALMNNFTSPRPLLFLVTIEPFMTLFKCPNDAIYSAETDAYFGRKVDYYSYKGCGYRNLYYKYSVSSREVLTDFPRRCEAIRLPVVLQQGPVTPDRSNVFSLLSPQYSITIQLSHLCDECHEKEGQCGTRNGTFRCVDAKEEKKDRKWILIPVLAGFAFISVLSYVVLVMLRRYKGNLSSCVSSKNEPRDVEDDSVYFGVPVFSYTELENATQCFNPSHELGDGGFGAVYYGKLRDGREVAVKRLYEHNYKRVQHFMNEVEILTRLRHQNLVVLYGCTSHQSRELLLVYEYIPNGTVADHLHGELANPKLLTWPIRMNIAIGTANALVFLHASEIIHRDVKTSNILLDHNFCVKVADFGISRLLPSDVTHVSTAPQGTPGYVDPQYHQCYQLTDKSDVYSFGIVLIELISSMAAVDMSRSRDEINLASLAINRIQRGELEQLIDPFLRSDMNGEIERMTTLVAELAFQCLQFYSEMRPTMNEVLGVLKDIRDHGRREAEDAKPPLPPSPEPKDVVVLLENHPCSPVSVTDKWHSNSSSSITPKRSRGALPNMMKCYED